MRRHGIGLVVFVALLVAPTGHREGDRDNTGSKDKGRDSRGDCEASENCQDNDGINADKVIICVQPDSCRWGEDESAALAKLDPILLVETIQNGAQAIGEAAGTMAGAIAAFPIGILLAEPGAPVGPQHGRSLNASEEAPRAALPEYVKF